MSHLRKLESILGSLRQNPTDFDPSKLPPYTEVKSRAGTVRKYIEDQAYAPWQRRLLAVVLLMQRVLELIDENGGEYRNMELDRKKLEETYYAAIGEPNAKEIERLNTTRTITNLLNQRNKILTNRNNMWNLYDDENHFERLRESNRQIEINEVMSIFTTIVQYLLDRAAGAIETNYAQEAERVEWMILRLLGFGERPKSTQTNYKEFMVEERSARKAIIEIARKAFQ